MEKTIFDSPYVYREIDENGNSVLRINDINMKVTLSLFNSLLSY